MSARRARPLVAAGERMGARRARPLVAAAVLVLTAACGTDVEPVPNTLPTSATGPTTQAPSAGGPSTPAPAAGGPLWTGPATTCPRLTGLAAASVNASGEGRPTADHRVDGRLTAVDCAWGSTDGQGVAIALRMTVYPAQAAADAAWQVLAAGQTDRLAGIGDEAYVADEPPAVAVRARSRNAVATVRLVLPEATPERLAQLHPTAGEITADMLDDLR